MANFTTRQQQIVDLVVQRHNDPTYENRTSLSSMGVTHLVTLAKLGLPVPEAQLRELVENFRISTKADFFLVSLARIVDYQPGVYDDIILPAVRELPGLWMSKGDLVGVFWSENHILMWHSCSLILEKHGFPLPSGFRERIMWYLQDKIDVGYYEFNSNVYYSYSLAGLLNLYDFASDPEMKELARRATLRLLQDYADYSTSKGIFACTAGRAPSLGAAYVEASVGRLAHRIVGLLTGKNFEVAIPSSESSAGFAFLALSDIDVSPVLAATTDKIEHRVVQLGHTIEEYRASAAAGLSDPRDRITFGWSMGMYFHPDSAYEMVKNIDDYDMWQNHQFSSRIPKLTPPLARVAANVAFTYLGAWVTSGTMVVHRDGDAILTSMQNYFPGRSGDQQIPWTANTGMATVFTVADSTDKEFVRRNRQRHFPNAKQVGNTVLLLYRANPDLTMIYGRTQLDVALYFPTDEFDETLTSQNWRFGREGDSYVGVLSPCDDPQLGCDGTKEQAWVAMVGHRERYGSFANFTSSAAQGRLEHDSGACFGVEFVHSELAEPLQIEWCRDSSPAYSTAVGVAVYFSLALLASIGLCACHCMKKPPLLHAAVPTCGRLALLISILFAVYPSLTFVFVLGMLGEGTPVTIAACFVGILVLIALHVLAFLRIKQKATLLATDQDGVSPAEVELTTDW